MDKEIQVSNNLDDNLCEDEPNEEYWKELAKEREKALNDTLEENRSLCELIQGNDWIITWVIFICFYFIKNITKKAMFDSNQSLTKRPVIGISVS